MSFAYKILNPSDITISPYTANKLYTFASSSLTEYGIVVYSGEYEPIINVSCSDGPATGQVPCNPYNPENDVTSNGYARRLIYDSIQKLYYQSFISGGFSNVLWVSSSYDNYLQTALTSGSNFLTNIRIFGQDSGSGGYFYNYSSSIYDTGSYPSDPSLIRVISIPQDIFGSGIKPGTFEISSSNYLIQDDGQGNLMDNISITSSLYAGTDYIANVYGATPDRQGVHVGNIIYSHGMIIITNEDYFCFYPSEPVAQNNYFSVLNVQPTKSLAVLTNDFDDCNELVTSSLSVVAPLAGYNFPDNTAVNGYINIGPTTSNLYQVTPGLYKGYYYVSNSAGVPSNYATVSLEIYSSPLQLNVSSYTSGCFGTTTSQSVTYSINYGVPPYSWSLNETTSWDGISNLYQPTLSLDVAPTTSILYIKDAVGEIVSQSIVSVGAPITYVTSSTPIVCAGGNGYITVTTASSDFYVSHSIDNSTWHTTYPYPYTQSAGNYYLYFKNNANCSTTSSVISLVAPQVITASLTLLQGDCSDPAVGNVGALSASVIGGIQPYSYTWYFNGSPLSPTQSTALPVGLQTGSYYVVVSDAGGGCNDGTSNTINLPTGSPITFTTTPTDITCYGSNNGTINLEFNGGLGSVTGSIYSGSTLLTSMSIVSGGPNGDLTATGLNSGSNYSVRLVDSRGCTISQSVTLYSPAAPLTYLGDFNILRPGGTASLSPYSASFSINGGNTASYNVTLSANIGIGGLQQITSGSFAGSASPTAISFSLDNVCLTSPTTWSIQVNDYYTSCSLTQSNVFYYPAQINQLAAQYGYDSFNVCTASISYLYTTKSENTGINNLINGTHIWSSCSLGSIPFNGYILSGSSPAWSYAVTNGVFTASQEDPCALSTVFNKIYIRGNWSCGAGVDYISTDTQIQLAKGGYMGANSQSLYSKFFGNTGWDTSGPITPGYTLLFNWTGSYGEVEITGSGDTTYSYSSFIADTGACNEINVYVYYAAKGSSPSTIYAGGTYFLWFNGIDPSNTSITAAPTAYNSVPLDPAYDYLIVPEFASSVGGCC